MPERDQVSVSLSLSLSLSRLSRALSDLETGRVLAAKETLLAMVHAHTWVHTHAPVVRKKKRNTPQVLEDLLATPLVDGLTAVEYPIPCTEAQLKELEECVAAIEVKYRERFALAGRAAAGKAVEGDGNPYSCRAHCVCVPVPDRIVCGLRSCLCRLTQ